MFFRIATIRRADTTYRYLQLCEAVRVDGRPRNRVLYNFGNLDAIPTAALAGMSDKLAQLAGDDRVRASTLHGERCRQYGPAAVARHLWDEFGLTERLRRLWAAAGSRRSFDPIPYLQLIVANRLVAPRSKLGVWAWAERVAIPAAEQASQLHHYYRALDALLAVKEPLEEELFGVSRDLFNLELDLVFYDLTSTYFEGHGPEAAAYGYSRDHRPDLQQVVLAMACDRRGFPIAHEVLAGNRADVSTVLGMVDNLRQRFAIRRCVFVADSGMVSTTNLEALEAAGYGYVVAVKRKHLSGMDELLQVPLDQYQETGHGLKIRVGEPDEQGRRLVCCYSAVRAVEQRQIREARVARAFAALLRLRASVQAGHLKDRDKIIARAVRHLTLAKASRYITYRAESGRFSFNRRRELLAREQADDGKYFLLASAPRLAPADIVDAYYTLQEIERAFRELKDFLKLRPIYHWSDARVKAHIFACVLAYLLEKALGAHLKRAKLDLSARRALDQLASLQLMESRLGDTIIRAVSHPAPQAQAVLNAIGLALPSTICWPVRESPPPLV
jgi:transposase